MVKREIKFRICGSNGLAAGSQVLPKQPDKLFQPVHLYRRKKIENICFVEKIFYPSPNEQYTIKRSFQKRDLHTVLLLKLIGIMSIIFFSQLTIEEG